MVSLVVYIHTYILDTTMSQYQREFLYNIFGTVSQLLNIKATTRVAAQKQVSIELRVVQVVV